MCMPPGASATDDRAGMGMPSTPRMPPWPYRLHDRVELGMPRALDRDAHQRDFSVRWILNRQVSGAGGAGRGRFPDPGIPHDQRVSRGQFPDAHRGGGAHRGERYGGAGKPQRQEPGPRLVGSTHRLPPPLADSPVTCSVTIHSARARASAGDRSRKAGIAPTPIPDQSGDGVRRGTLHVVAAVREVARRPAQRSGHTTIATPCRPMADRASRACRRRIAVRLRPDRCSQPPAAAGARRSPRDAAAWMP